MRTGFFLQNVARIPYYDAPSILVFSQGALRKVDLAKDSALLEDLVKRKIPKRWPPYQNNYLLCTVNANRLHNKPYLSLIKKVWKVASDMRATMYKHRIRGTPLSTEDQAVYLIYRTKYYELGSSTFRSLNGCIDHFECDIGIGIVRNLLR